jgi:hypothetical protein
VSDATGRSSFVDTPVTVSTCGSASPTVTATASPASPNTGGLVALSLTIADADNAPGCALGQTLSASTGFIQRPAGSAAAMAPAEGLTPGFIAANPGTYVLRSTVTDSTGRFATVDTSVTVSSCGAAQPSITGVTVTPATPHPGNAVQLAVAATDADNNAPCSQNQTLTYATTIIAQPAGSNVTLVPAAGPNTQFTPTLVGTYVLRTIVTDTTTRNSAINTTVVVTP